MRPVLSQGVPVFGNTVILLPSNKRQIDFNAVSYLHLGEAAFSRVQCHSFSFPGLLLQYFMDSTQ